MIFIEARKMDLVTLLAQLGFAPAKIQRQDYWYKSPFRNERTASFKVSRERNIWYDHGEGAGGNVIDFISKFYQCDAAEAAKKILELQGDHGFSFHPPTQTRAAAGEKKEYTQNKIVIQAVRPLQNSVLLNYLQERKIPIEIAQQYCKEVDFLLYKKRHTVIGFENQAGGFELRSPSFKGSSSPKDVTFLDKGKQEVCVFEGFFDFLSFAVMRPKIVSELTNCIVLNSLAFFEKSRALMEQHDKVFLFLDQEQSARQKAQTAAEWNKEVNVTKYTDCSHFYRHHEDLNAWLVQQSQPRQKPSTRLGRGM